MGLRIDPARASPLRRMETARSQIATGFRRLSAGLRIATAADDPGRLGHAEALRARIRSLDQASRNASDGLALVQVAEASLDEVAGIAARMRQLLVQAQNPGTTAADRNQIEHDFGVLSQEANRIAMATTWNGQRLLDGSGTIVDLQVGAGNVTGVDTLRIQLGSALATTLGLMAPTANGLPLPDTEPHPPPVPWSLSSVDVSSMDRSIDALASVRANLSASRSRLDRVLAHLASDSDASRSANGRIRDVDAAATTADTVRASIIHDGAVSLLGQANLHAVRVLQLLQ